MTIREPDGTKIRLNCCSGNNDCKPTNEAISKLREILRNGVGGSGILDLIWGPELELEDYKGNNNAVQSN